MAFFSVLRPVVTVNNIAVSFVKLGSMAPNVSSRQFYILITSNFVKPVILFLIIVIMPSLLGVVVSGWLIHGCLIK